MAQHGRSWLLSFVLSLLSDLASVSPEQLSTQAKGHSLALCPSSARPLRVRKRGAPPAEGGHCGAEEKKWYFQDIVFGQLPIYIK